MPLLSLRATLETDRYRVVKGPGNLVVCGLYVRL